MRSRLARMASNRPMLSDSLDLQEDVPVVGVVSARDGDMLAVAGGGAGDGSVGGGGGDGGGSGVSGSVVGSEGNGRGGHEEGTVRGVSMFMLLLLFIYFCRRSWAVDCEKSHRVTFFLSCVRACVCVRLWLVFRVPARLFFVILNNSNGR